MAQISILVPVYNEEAFLRETLESVRQQTYQDFVCLISDNASTDKSVSIANEFSAKDNRFIVFEQPSNIGAVLNSAFLYGQVETDYCMFFSAHDVLAPTFLSATVEVMQANPNVSLSFSYVEWIDENGRNKGWNQEAVYRFIGQPMEKYLAAIRDLRDCTIYQSVFRTVDLSDYEFKVVHGPDHIVLSRLLWKGELMLIQEALYRRRAFVDHSRGYMERIVGSQSDARLSLLTDAWIADFRKLYHGSWLMRLFWEIVLRNAIEEKFFGLQSIPQRVVRKLRRYLNL